MRKGPVPATRETRWTPGARWTLVAAVLFILLNIAQLGYRLTIPSLGWASLDPDSLDESAPYFELESNVAGGSPLLRPGDRILTVGGIPAFQSITSLSWDRQVPSDWEIGGRTELEVDRQGEILNVEVPLVRWTLAAWWRTNLTDPAALWEWVVTLLLFGAVTFAFLNRPGNLAARFLFAFGLANLSITLGASVRDYVSLFFDSAALFAKVFFSNIVFAYLLAPSFLGFALTFPRAKGRIRQDARLLTLPYLAGFSTVVLLLVAPEQAVIGFDLTFAMLLLGVIGLIHAGFTARDAISRAQMRWAIFGLVAGVLVFMLNFATNSVGPYRDLLLAVASLGFPVVGFSLAIAILRYRLFDIDLIIRRTLQYTVLTALLALVYFGSVALLQSLVESLTGQESPFVIVLSTLAIAALFNPLRSRIQNFIDRRFFRRKYDAERALTDFAAIARDEVDMDRLTAALLGVVAETLQPDEVILWLRELKTMKDGSEPTQSLASDSVP